MHAFGARYNRPIHDLDYIKPTTQNSPTKSKSKSPQQSYS
jgi:hypothetical protein